MDCRFYINFINIKRIKSAASFINAKADTGSAGQFQALHRARLIYFHTEQLNDIRYKQYSIPLKAVDEETKFL